jgi:hypothetical protein
LLKSRRQALHRRGAEALLDQFSATAAARIRMDRDRFDIPLNVRILWTETRLVALEIGSHLSGRHHVRGRGACPLVYLVGVSIAHTLDHGDCLSAQWNYVVILSKLFLVLMVRANPDAVFEIKIFPLDVNDLALAHCGQNQKLK